jgi:hypothetical protein
MKKRRKKVQFQRDIVCPRLSPFFNPVANKHTLLICGLAVSLNTTFMAWLSLRRQLYVLRLI